MLKSLGNWSSTFVGRLYACLKNQTFERQWKMCSTGLNACNLGYGGKRTRISHPCHGKHGEHRKNCTVIEWKEASHVQAGRTRDGRNDFSGPRFPRKSPQMGKGYFSPHCHTKCQFSFTQEIKDNLNSLGMLLIFFFYGLLPCCLFWC